MKKLLFLVGLINISLTLFSNDTFYYIAGGNIVPAETNQTYVEMIDEIINIELFDNYYSVTVDFTFYNNGEDEYLLVGFPYLLRKQGGKYSTSIYDFRTWINGQLAEHSNNRIEYSEQGYGETITDHVFTKNVYFPSGEITKTKIEYKAEYGREAGHVLATYFYGSGMAWYGNIGRMTINIKNNILKGDAWIYDIQLPNIQTENFINWNSGYMQIQLHEIEPENRDTIIISFSDPLWDTGPRVFTPERFYYRTHLLGNKELRLLSSSQLRILRNSFYAFYGYNFRDESLRAFFLKFDDPAWYVVDENFSESMLTEIELNNVNRILEEEKLR